MLENDSVIITRETPITSGFAEENIFSIKQEKNEVRI